MSISPQNQRLSEAASGTTVSTSARPAVDWPTLLLGCVLALAGLYVFSSHIADLWLRWNNDALRSIGMLMPPATVWLALRAWNLKDWCNGGSWWGLPPLLLALLLGSLVSAAPLTFAFFYGPHFASINLIPDGVLIWLYANGVVLLLGGVRPWRKAWFALALLLFLNPVPHSFNLLVDLPLQIFAAHIARGFASLLDVPVSTGLLQMMFAPNLGMFIAPGCDGLRGAVTMGYLASVAGYLYQLSWRRWVVYALAAVLLAYLFNLIRLCGVVIYYWFALRITAIDGYGTQVDYLIGGALFAAAVMFVLGVPRYWRPSHR